MLFLSVSCDSQAAAQAAAAALSEVQREAAPTLELLDWAADLRKGMEALTEAQVRRMEV